MMIDQYTSTVFSTFPTYKCINGLCYFLDDNMDLRNLVPMDVHEPSHGLGGGDIDVVSRAHGLGAHSRVNGLGRVIVRIPSYAKHDSRGEMTESTTPAVAINLYPSR